MAKRAADCPGVLSEGSFGAFVLDQLSEQGGVDRGADVRRRGLLPGWRVLGLFYEERLYFRVSPETVGKLQAGRGR